MSLPTASRGEKDYLRGEWSRAEFDLERACRTYGRNDAFWVLCYRRHLDGEPLPDQRERNRLVRDANRATGGLDQLGERERYTRHEAQATIDQVSRYRGRGLNPLLARRRRWARGSRSRRAIEPTKRLLEAICDVARQSGCATFACSHRRLAAMTGVDRSRVAYLLGELERAGQVFRRGFTPARDGWSRGTTILSLKPPRPAQRVDEQGNSTWNCKEARWTWPTPLARGTITPYQFRRALARGGSVPNVLRSLLATIETPLDGPISGHHEIGSSPRGSP